MPNRLIATEIWQRPWFRDLTPLYKCFWLYILSNCDCAGIWYVDFRAASFAIGQNVDSQQALSLMEKQVLTIDRGHRWLIKDFIKYQTRVAPENLNPKNPFHYAILRSLKENFIEISKSNGEFLSSKSTKGL